MAKSFVKLNYGGVRELLKSAEMDSVLSGYASAVVNAAGDEFEAHKYTGASRIAYTVTPSTPRAAAIASRENTLLKALGAAKK